MLKFFCIRGQQGEVRFKTKGQRSFLQHGYSWKLTTEMKSSDHLLHN